MINTFANMLKYLRERDGYTQEELAKRLNISRSALANYEQGRRTPNHELEETIADLFNVDLNTLRGLPTPELDEETIYVVESYKKLKDTDKGTIKRLLAYMLAINGVPVEEAVERAEKGVEGGN